MIIVAHNFHAAQISCTKVMWKVTKYLGGGLKFRKNADVIKGGYSNTGTCWHRGRGCHKMPNVCWRNMWTVPNAHKIIYIWLLTYTLIYTQRFKARSRRVSNPIFGSARWIWAMYYLLPYHYCWHFLESYCP